MPNKKSGMPNAKVGKPLKRFWYLKHRLESLRDEGKALAAKQPTLEAGASDRSLRFYVVKRLQEIKKEVPSLAAERKAIRLEIVAAKKSGLGKK